MESTLTRVLTPNKRVDLLAAATAARAEKRPYTIVFVGVNGVGKSTSLSKVAYYLKTNGFTPMLCACDTFRAGAVEQLRVHAQSLELPLFEKEVLLTVVGGVAALALLVMYVRSRR